MKISHWILRLYPPQWRSRYEQEMLSVLEQHHVTLLTLLDLTLGALDVRLNPDYRSEKNPLVPQSVQATALIFVAILAIATFLVDRWQTMIAATFRGMPVGMLAGGLLSFNITSIVLYGEYLLLCILAFCVMVNIVKKARAARRRGTVIVAAICVLLPLLITSYAIVTSRLPAPIFISEAVSLFLLLLLITCGLFTFVIKLKETLVVPQKRLLFLIMSMVLLISFGFYFFYPHMNFTFGIAIAPDEVQFVGISRLVPFISIGALMLTIGTEANNWWKGRARLASLATVLAGGVVSNLIAIFIWYVNFWTASSKGVYEVQQPPIFMLVALVGTSVLLLLLLLRGWMLATSKQAVALSQEQQASH